MTDFIRNIITEDLKNNSQLVTRFPPEPNGYLHIGHAKSICLNFGLAKEYEHINARCHLRFDDTNPVKEDELYVKSIQEDVKWLGFDWDKHLYHASDYFDQLYSYAQELIKMDKAYVCELSGEDIRKQRGTLTEAGENSPYRNRPAQESLELFEQMKNGAFEEGSHVLRAKIDMSAPNINLRDPVIYRIRKVTHQRTGDNWHIYPMYDYAHCISDALEGITHSLCTLEFEDHRPLYDWFLDTLKTTNHPQQIEFARLNLEYTIMSKRKLLELVTENHVSGWDDPRLPTLQGMRRRGYTPQSIRVFCDTIGIGKKETSIDMSILEDCVRADLETKAPRAMAVLNPIKVTIENYPADKIQEIEVKNHPKDESFGKRKIPFTKEIFIERDDFMESPPKKFFRLSPGGQVRLRNAYVITCHDVIKDTNGNITELKCSYNPDTFGGKTPEGHKKVKGIIHWVSATQSLPIEVRLYDRLFTEANPTADKNTDYKTHLNPDSLTTLTNARAEPSLQSAKAGDQFQFERLGYFCVDLHNGSSNTAVFNRTVTLRDTWKKLTK